MYIAKEGSVEEVDICRREVCDLVEEKREMHRV